MKAKLIIVYWMASFFLLVCMSEDIVFAIILVSNFGYATCLLNRNEKEAMKHIVRFEDRLLTVLKIK